MPKQKQFWFKRRRYGWGWIPVTWQGWLSVAAVIVLIFIATQQLPPEPDQPSTDELLRFFAILGFSIILALLISSAKGPTPRWRWGKKPSDNPDEDF